MATMNSVIEYVDGVKPNVYTDNDKYRWIGEVEGLISIEVHDMNEPLSLAYPEEADKELSVPAPYDEVYALYVFAKIDFLNKEYNNYNNSVLMFNNMLNKYKDYYIQRNAHGKAQNFRNIMG